VPVGSLVSSGSGRKLRGLSHKVGMSLDEFAGSCYKVWIGQRKAIVRYQHSIPVRSKDVRNGVACLSGVTNWTCYGAGLMRNQS